MLDGCSALTIKNRESASAIPIPVSSPKTGLSTFTPRVCQDFGRGVRANRNALIINAPHHTVLRGVPHNPARHASSAHAARRTDRHSLPMSPFRKTGMAGTTHDVQSTPSGHHTPPYLIIYTHARVRMYGCSAVRFMSFGKGKCNFFVRLAYKFIDFE